MRCFFCSDLHGKTDRYRKLFDVIRRERPDAVFLGGDLLPSGAMRFSSESEQPDFIDGYLAPAFLRLSEDLGGSAPEVFLILGNDDGRFEEEAVLEGSRRGLWHYAHGRRLPLGDFSVYGYSYVPPTPFLLKDWERYDVSRFVDPGCVAPGEGIRTVPVDEREVEWSTMAEDLAHLAGDDDLSKAVILFHAPPHGTSLDKAALDGRMVDSVPLDVHIGSIAIGRFIQARKPLLTLHGHVHEAARLTGVWKERLGETWMLGAAHDGPELALVRFSPEDPASASRELL
jgi:Icc-related predicted phosphoesterase